MSKTIKTRINDLEEKQKPDRQIIAIFQDMDDPDLWHPGNDEGGGITWDQVEADYGDEYMIIKVVYVQVPYEQID